MATRAERAAAWVRIAEAVEAELPVFGGKPANLAAWAESARAFGDFERSVSALDALKARTAPQAAAKAKE